VSFSEKSNYSDLWEEILADLSLEKNDVKKIKKVKINRDMEDEDFKRIIDRIMKEATQY
jgi:hypothetical protein